MRLEQQGESHPRRTEATPGAATSSAGAMESHQEVIWPGRAPAPGKEERSKEVDRKELENAVLDAALAICKRWGPTVIAPGIGKVERSRDGYSAYVTPGADAWGTIPLGSEWQAPSLRDLETAERLVIGIARYCASEDFLGKVAGSIRRMKAIARAIQS